MVRCLTAQFTAKRKRPAFALKRPGIGNLIKIPPELCHNSNDLS